MSNIEWNKVTWYSKLIALVIFIVLPFFGFWLGIQYGEMVAPLAVTSSSSGGSSVTGPATSNYFSNVAEWQTDQRSDGGFSIAYPIDFQADDNYSMTALTDWRVGANGESGQKLLAITIPRIFEPQTNFADATLTVGKSSVQAAVAACLTPDQTAGPGAGMATTTINGIAFSIFKSSSAGAGNFYETTSYRTMHAGACYAVEYTIHSSQIGNYPPSYNLKPFDENQVAAVLDRMVGTFKFQ
jgi:hypothetical protein